METSLKTGFAQIFPCCPKNLSRPKFGGGGCSPPRPPRPVRLCEKELNRASRSVKEWKFSNGELDCSLACRESLFLLHVTCQSPIVREN